MRLEAEFVSSAMALSDCPRWARAEVALAGRSNVGKSSLLNALSARKHLARISRTPGRTRCLNFFSVGDDLSLVDLPGYGFAKISKVEAARIARLMDDYLQSRRNLVALILLVDVRRGPEEEEFALSEMMRRSGEKGHGLIVAATKCDKLKRSERAAALKRFEPMKILPALCSAVSGEGIEELRRRILMCAPTNKADIHLDQPGVNRI
jgi:GTP-binding protein